MKDISHHRKYIQKKVLQSVRKESNQEIKNNHTINGVNYLAGEISLPGKVTSKSV